MSNWLEEEKERKKLREIEKQEEIVRKERIATQIKPFKNNISLFYSYVNKVKDEGFSIKVIENSSGEFEFNNDSNDNYRSVKIKSSTNNCFFVSITGTYNTSGYDYGAPIVEEISNDGHSYIRETRKQKYVSYDTRKEILKIECKEDELIRFLNKEANALKIIGWLFDKTKLHTRWFPGVIPAELEYKNHIKKATENYNSELAKKIGKTVLVSAIIGLVLGFIINLIFNSVVAMFWTILICLVWAIVFPDSDWKIYRITGRPAKEDPKKFNFEF